MLCLGMTRGGEVPEWAQVEMVRVVLPAVGRCLLNPLKILAKAFWVIRALAPHDSSIWGIPGGCSVQRGGYK